MALRRRIQKAGRKLLAHVKGASRALKRRGKNRGLARDAPAPEIDVRLLALAEEVLKGRSVESAWDAFRLMHFPEYSDTLADQEQAAVRLGHWARRNGVRVQYVKRAVLVGSLERYVIYVIFSAG